MINGEQNLDLKKMEDKVLTTYRLRVGTYRIVFEDHKKEVVVLIIRVDHRKSVYRDG